MIKISVLSDIHILNEAKNQIQELSSEIVDFSISQVKNINEHIERSEDEV